MQVNVYGLALTSPRRGKEVLSLVGGETGPQEEGILSQVIYCRTSFGIYVDAFYG